MSFWQTKIIPRLNAGTALQIYQVWRWSVLFLTSFLLVKTGLSTFQIGQWEQFNFETSAVTFFWISGLIQAFLPFVKQEVNKQNKSRELFTIALLIAVLSFFAAIILVIYDGIKTGNFFSLNHLFFLIYLLANNPSFLIEYIYLISNKPLPMIIYGAISNAFLLLLVILPSYITLNTSYIIGGLVIASLLKFIWLVKLLSDFTIFSVQTEFAKKIIIISIPLIISALLAGLGEYVNGTIVVTAFGQATFALYRYGAKELPLAVLLAAALNVSMLTQFSITHSIEELKKRSTRLMHFIFPVSILFAVISKPLFVIALDSRFSASSEVFSIFLLMVISRLVFPQTILMGLHKNNILLKASVFELGVNISLSLIFVFFLGIEGIAISTLIAYGLEKVYLILVLRKKFEIPFYSYCNVTIWLTYSSVLILVFILGRIIF